MEFRWEKDIPDSVKEKYGLYTVCKKIVRDQQEKFFWIKTYNWQENYFQSRGNMDTYGVILQKFFLKEKIGLESCVLFSEPMFQILTVQFAK